MELKIGVSPADVTITLPSTDDDGGGSGRRKITEEMSLEKIAKSASTRLADEFRAFLREVEQIGIEPERRDSSISLFWHEPNTRRRFSFGSVYAEDTRVKTKFVRMSYLKIGLDEGIGMNYIRGVAAVVPGATVYENMKDEKAWTRVYVGTREVSLADLLPKSAAWLAAIQTAVTETEIAAAAKAANSISVADVAGCPARRTSVRGVGSHIQVHRALPRSEHWRRAALLAGRAGSELVGATFPLGTLLVNISGCLIMRFLFTAWTGPVLIRPEIRDAVFIGVLGGYTTFSSFGRETMALANEGEWGRAGLYVLGSVALSLAGVWLGSAIAGRLYGTGGP